MQPLTCMTALFALFINGPMPRRRTAPFLCNGIFPVLYTLLATWFAASLHGQCLQGGPAYRSNLRTRPAARIAQGINVS